MEFKYKAKVDKKWLKGRSLTDHKEDATEFETESEPTQIINKLTRRVHISMRLPGEHRTSEKHWRKSRSIFQAWALIQIQRLLSPAAARRP